MRAYDAQPANADAQRADVQRRLARVVLALQNYFVDREDCSQAGALLVQVWLPQRSDAGGDELVTKGLPFCVAGTGDLLALFRCISCRFAFAADAARPEALGAPGRVFCAGEPELAANVQAYPRAAYLRRAEAEQCRVQSSMLLPVFGPAAPAPRAAPPGAAAAPARAPAPAALGVVEVVQSADDMAFLPVVRLLREALAGVGLGTCGEAEVAAHLPAAPSHLALPAQTGVLGARGAGDSSDEAGSPRRGAAGAGGADGAGDGGGARGGGGGGRAGGKPGARLSFEDLQGQFGLGLREAAARLGVCPTTLKRACRRHGIQRWPRRALARVSRALDEMERGRPAGGAADAAAAAADAAAAAHAAAAAQQQQHAHLQALQQAHAHAAAAQRAQQQAQLGDDRRWAQLASFIPMYHVAEAAAAAAAGGGAGGAGGAWSPRAAAQLAAAQAAADALPPPPLAPPPPPIAPADSDASWPEGAAALGPRAGGGGAAAAAPVLSADSGLSGWDPRTGAVRGGATRLMPLPAPHGGGGAAGGGLAPDVRGVVPAFLQPGAGAGAPTHRAADGPAGASLLSGMDDPVLRLPHGAAAFGGGAAAGGPSLSQLSVPSLGGLAGGSLAGCAPLFGGGSFGGDDVGLLDGSVLQLMLADSGHQDLRRLFPPGSGGASPGL